MVSRSIRRRQQLGAGDRTWAPGERLTVSGRRLGVGSELGFIRQGPRERGKHHETS